MTIKYGFFNSIDGDRKYNAETIGRYLCGLVSSGVYADSSTSLQVLASDGMTVAVQPGRAMLDHHYLELDAQEYLTLDTGDTLPRYDAIVARLDIENRICTVAVVKGTPASDPTIPAVTRTETVKEWLLGAVYVNKLATALTQSAITDTRADSTVCGWVTGLIEQVDTSTLFAQWQAAYADHIDDMANFEEQAQADFNTWWATISEGFTYPAPSPAVAGQYLAANAEGTGYEFKAIEVPKTQLATVTLSAAGWSGEGPYTQGVTLAGVTASHKVDLQPDAAALSVMIEAKTTALYIVNDGGALTAYALGAAPGADLELQVSIQEVEA